MNPISTMMKPRPSHTEKAGCGHDINLLGFELEDSLSHQQGRFGISLDDLLECSGHVENNQWDNNQVTLHLCHITQEIVLWGPLGCEVPSQMAFS